MQNDTSQKAEESCRALQLRIHPVVVALASLVVSVPSDWHECRPAASTVQQALQSLITRSLPTSSLASRISAALLHTVSQ